MKGPRFLENPFFPSEIREGMSSSPPEDFFSHLMNLILKRKMVAICD